MKNIFFYKLHRKIKAVSILALIALLLGITLQLQYAAAESGLSDLENPPMRAAQNNGPPPSGTWCLLAIDLDEGVGSNLKEVYWRASSNVLYFKVVFYRTWTNLHSDIDTGIFLNIDQNAGTGLTSGYYSDDNGVGADFLIVVGIEGDSLWQWAGTLWNQGAYTLAYLDAPDNSDTFLVGVYLTDLGISTQDCIDVTVGDIRSGWDWMPDSGQITICLSTCMEMAVGGTIIPVNDFVILMRSKGLMVAVTVVASMIILKRRLFSDR